MRPETLPDYMSRYARDLATNASAIAKPLHTPGVTPTVPCGALLKKPLEAQEHVITAAIRSLDRERSILLDADPGTGKTLMAIATCHLHARNPYRAIVACPPHLTGKWQRELEEALPFVNVTQVESYRQLTSRRHEPRQRPLWFVVATTTAKLSPSWKPSYLTGYMPMQYSRGLAYRHAAHRFQGYLYCPSCGTLLSKIDARSGAEEPLSVSDLERSRKQCESCNEPLYQWTHDMDRWPVASYIAKKMPGYFDYAIIDECHLAKSSETAIGNAAGALMNAARYSINLTGTVFGGYAWHVRSMLWRMAPHTMVRDGQTWTGESAFNEQYGRIERRVTDTVSLDSRDNAMSRGRSTRTQKFLRPGIMPFLFGKHIAKRSIRLGLEEVSSSLPPIEQEIVSCTMDAELQTAYDELEDAIRNAMKHMMASGNKRGIGQFLHILLGYPDMPYGWKECGYYDRDVESLAQVWVHVATPHSLSDCVRPKERAVVTAALQSREQGRKAWVYSIMTDAHDCNARLESLMKAAGLRCHVLRSSVPPKKREEWIAKHGPIADVIISHPSLVETGLDFFDKGFTYNFPDIMFYQTGYNPFTLTQAAARARRIGQRSPCRTKFFYYESSMQTRAMCLMGKKIAASKAMEGVFDSSGIASLANDDSTLNMALARSLVDQLDDLNAGRQWGTIKQR